jgi:hypothetical protein
MRVNSTTLLFESLTCADAAELLVTAEQIVLHGKIPNPLPPHVERWLQCGGFDDRQRLLTLSVVYPQRALLSVAMFYANKAIGEP